MKPLQFTSITKWYAISSNLYNQKYLIILIDTDIIVSLNGMDIAYGMVSCLWDRMSRKHVQWISGREMLLKGMNNDRRNNNMAQTMMVI